jgi:hypothetical protein
VALYWIAFYRKTFHAVFLFHLYFFFIPKYRRPVLVGDDALHVRDLVRKICNSMGIGFVKGRVRHRRVDAAEFSYFGRQFFVGEQTLGISKI